MILGENGAKVVLWSVLGLAVILVALIVILAIRRIFGASFNMSGSADRRNRPARLGVTDFFNLDRQGRRLVIVRRDNVEHLVLIGGPNDLLIEQNIIRGIRPELPVVDTSSRPTVSSKMSDDSNVEAPSTTGQNTRFDIPDRATSITNIPTAPKPDPAPVASTVSRLNIPKLNVPNLDLRTATPAQKTAPVKSEPVETAQKAPVPEILQTSFAEASAQEIMSIPKTDAPVKLPEILANLVVSETPKAQERANQPISTAFGDATKRLEEALRRPIASSQSKIAEQTPKLEPAPKAQPAPIELAKTVLAEKTPQNAQIPVSKPEPDVITKSTSTATSSYPATDTLVLDLEQEMARLLGRVPGKGT